MAETSTAKVALSIGEAAEALSTSRNTLYLEIAKGRLRTYTVGKRRFVSAAALREYVAAREAEAAHGLGKRKPCAG